MGGTDRYLTAGLTLAAMLAASLSGCSQSAKPVAAQTVRTIEIATDLPLQGAPKSMSEDTNNAIELYLEQVHNTAGKYPVSLRRYDNATAAKGAWDDETCVKNAHEHLLSEEVAIIGTYNSGCARLMVPVLNQPTETPLMMISHANSNPGLTKPWGKGEPAKFAPSGRRSFARITATDDIHGAAAAAYIAKTLHLKRCYILNDGEVYGTGVAKAFSQASQEQGIKLLGNTSWDVGQSSYRALFEKISRLRPDCIYIAGVFENNVDQLIKDKVAVLGNNKKVALVAPDGLSGYPELYAMPEAAGLFVTLGGLSTEQLVKTSPKAAALVTAFKARYGAPPASSYSIYGVAALQVVLAAIAASDGTRKGVNEAVFGPTELTVPAQDSITGRELTINSATGDAKTVDITMVQVRNGKEIFVAGQVVS